MALGNIERNSQGVPVISVPEAAYTSNLEVRPSRVNYYLINFEFVC